MIVLTGKRSNRKDYLALHLGTVFEDVLTPDSVQAVEEVSIQEKHVPQCPGCQLQEEPGDEADGI